LPLALLARPKPDDPQAALEAAVQRLQDAPKLAALVPPPRAHLSRFHGVFAPNAKLRAQLTPSGRGKHRSAD